MYISSLHYNKDGYRKVTVCIYHHFIIKRKDEKRCSMYISSLYDNKEWWKKVAVCIYHHFIITRKDKKSCSMYISSLYYNKEWWKKLQYVYIITLLKQGRMKKVAVCIYHHFIMTRKDEKSCSMYILSLHY